MDIRHPGIKRLVETVSRFTWLPESQRSSVTCLITSNMTPITC